MAKRPNITTVASGYFGREALNDNFQELQAGFDNTLSLDGSTPNAMQADLDLNGNDITNAGGIIIGGQNVIALLNTSVSSVAASAAQAISSSNAAAASASSAAADAISAAADAASAATSWGYFSPYTTEIQILADDLIDGSFVAGDIYDFGSITTATTGTSGSPDGFIVTVYNNLADITTVAGIDADVTTVAGISADVSSVATIGSDVTTVSGISGDVTTVAGISANVTSVAGNAANIATVGAIASDVSSVAGISSDVTSAASISADITTVAADSADIQSVGANISNVNIAAGIASDITTVAADAVDIGTVSGLSTEVAALGPISADITTAAGISSNITTVATNDANITTVAGISSDVTTVSGISSNVTTVAGISSDVTAVVADAADIGTVSTNIADVNTVAGITGNIATVASNASDITTVATDITNVNTVASNIADVNSFGQTYRIGATDPTTSLDVGDLFFNSTTGVLKVYDGSGWTAGVTAGSGFLALTGGTLTGDLVLNADPTLAKGAATKEYVDTIAAAGLHYHDPVRVESPVDLPSTYNNGASGVGATLTNSGTQAALVVDGVTLSTNDRVLLYHQSNAAHNGVYEVTDTGSASTNWVLTRTSDADTYAPSDPNNFGQGDAFFVQEGATGAGELYVMNTSGAITFGTTNITFTQISSAAIYSAGTGVTLNGTEINIGQAVGTTDSPTFANISAANITVTGNVDGRDVSADGAVIDGLHPVASSGDFNDLSNQPTPFDPNTLATVATTGDYTDLINIPAAIPTGIITMWSGSVASIPSGWNLCDGTNSTPDLRDKFVIGAGGGLSPAATGGQNSVTLSTSNLPSHTHSFSANTSGGGNHRHSGNTSNTGNHRHNTLSGYGNGAGAAYTGSNKGNSFYTGYAGNHSHSYTTNYSGNHSHSVSGTTGSAGSGTSFDNRPSYYALAYIMKA